MPVILPNGLKVRDTHSPTGFMMSPISDLSSVAEAGRSLRPFVGALEEIKQMSPTLLVILYYSIGRYLGHGGIFEYGPYFNNEDPDAVPKLEFIEDNNINKVFILILKKINRENIKYSIEQIKFLMIIYQFQINIKFIIISYVEYQEVKL